MNFDDSYKTWIRNEENKIEISNKNFPEKNTKLYLCCHSVHYDFGLFIFITIIVLFVSVLVVIITYSIIQRYSKRCSTKYDELPLAIKTLKGI